METDGFGPQGLSPAPSHPLSFSFISRGTLDTYDSNQKEEEQANPACSSSFAPTVRRQTEEAALS